MFVFLWYRDLNTPRLNLPQVISCEKRFRSGFLLQIRRLITMLNVKPIKMGLLHGSLKDVSTVNGRRKALFYGPMEIVRFSILSPSLLLIISGFIAGSGKSVLW